MLFFSSFKYTLIIWIANLLFIFPQNKNNFSNYDSIKNIILDEVIVESSRFKIDTQIDYLLLRYRVLKVYPFIDSIQTVLSEADTVLKSFKNKRFARRYTRKFQKNLIYSFSNSITNLTRKEGVILSKLVHREFDITVYDLINKYRGSFQAFLWHNLSKIYEGNLKTNFDPQNNKEDFYINKIIQQEYSE